MTTRRMVKEKLQNLKDLGLEGQHLSRLGDGEVALVDFYISKLKDAAPMLHSATSQNHSEV